MKHLNDEQLSARLDRQLPPREADAAERHLADCAACRDRLAALSGADASLARALDHDPGEAYFESFADRVRERIAAGGVSPRAVADPAGRVRPSWWSSPSSIAWAGAAATIVVAGTFAVQFAIQHSDEERSAARRPVVATDRLESRAAAPSRAPAPGAEPPADSRPGAGNATRAPVEAPRLMNTPGAALDEARSDADAGAKSRLGGFREESRLRDQPSAPARQNESAPPGRMQELKTQPGGEQVPAQTRALPGADKQRSFAQAPSPLAKPAKPMALPMSPAPATAEKRSVVRATAPSPAASAPSVAPSEEVAASRIEVRAEEGATFRLCGKVTNAQGQPLAGATVTAVESGHSVTSGEDGSYCLEAPSPRATLSVLAMGYREFRAAVRPEDSGSSFAVALKPVETLGPGGLPTARFVTPPPVAQGATGNTSPTWGTAKSLFDSKDAKLETSALAGEAPEAALARAAGALALRVKSASAWSRAGVLWTAAANGAKSEPAADEALYRAAEARMNGWRLARGDANRRAAVEATDAALARMTASARRDTVEKWRKELPDR